MSKILLIEDEAMISSGGSVVRKIIDKYGLINVIISLICCVVFILNCLFITKASLININENIAVAWLLNFLAGCEGILGKWGSMSYATAFEELQLWRLVTHAYLHGGIIHMVFNLSALLVVGKYVEKQLGTVKYLTVYHIITIIDAVVIEGFLFTNSVSVGASGGIFGVIGIAFVMFMRKQLRFKKSEIVWLIIFVLIASVLGMNTLLLHALGFVLGVISGFILIRKNDAK